MRKPAEYQRLYFKGGIKMAGGLHSIPLIWCYKTQLQLLATRIKYPTVRHSKITLIYLSIRAADTAYEGYE